MADEARWQPRRLLVPTDAAGRRLDLWLSREAGLAPRSQVKLACEAGLILVDDGPAKASLLLRGGESLCVTAYPLPGAMPATGRAAEPEDIPLDIIHADSDLVAVNKVPGMVVHPAAGHPGGTLVNAILHHFPGSRWPGQPGRAGIVHRLDRDTTGVVIVGKKPYVHREVQRQFEKRQVSKTYLALTNGHFPPDHDEIDIPIGEGRCLQSALEHGVLRKSRTLVTVLGTYEDCSLLRCVPCTGRQNQIRVHLAALGHPIVGDERYDGDSPGERPGRKSWPLRYLLHSESIRFWHPRLKQNLELRAPVPPDFQELL